MRVALNNANLDMIAQYDNYVCRITDADGDPGKALLDEFSKIHSDEPVIVVTSQLLTTGIDLPSVKNIVILRRIGSPHLFKQIIGRGTRLCLEAHKGSFDIIDFVEATTLFNDPAFDGPPLQVIDDEADEQGVRIASETGEEDAEQVAEADAAYEAQDKGALLPDSTTRPHALSTEDDELMAKLGHPEADPLDLLINAAWELPLVSRAERALRVQREDKEFLESFAPKTRAVLDALLDKFAEHGAQELNVRALRVPPFTEMGNVVELGDLFCGRDALHEAIDNLGRHLFDVG